MLIASQLRSGMAIRLEGQIYKVLEVEVKAGGGKLSGVVKTKLRSMSSGRIGEPHFRPEERLQELQVSRQNMEFLYSDAQNCVFMNPDNFEQVEITRAVLGPGERFLQPSMQVPVEFFEGQAISAVFPAIAEVRVAETAPPVHSGQDNTWKEARLENGLPIRVPLFVAPGELIRVDTESGRYIERVRLERKRGA